MSAAIKILLIVLVFLLGAIVFVIKYWRTIIDISTVLRKITVKRTLLYIRRHWLSITLTGVGAALAIVALIALLPDNSNELVYVTETGSRYHTFNCQHLSTSKISIRLADAVKKYQPCSMCKPPILQEGINSLVNYLFNKARQLVTS